MSPLQQAIVSLGIVSALALAQSRSASVMADAGANLPAQKIRANDLLAISVYDAPELTRTVRVGDDGKIRLPMLKKQIAADGLLPAELEKQIAAELKAGEILVDPVVTVTVAEYHSRPISIAGAVKNPTTFQAIGPVPLLEALTRAGGLSPEAGPEILVTRAQPGPDGKPTSLTQRILVKALIDAADPEVNVRLVGGEEIRVPEVGKIFVVGNVKKPGIFPVEDSSETTVLKALAVAEGLTPYASKQAYIIRRTDSAAPRNEIEIPLQKILERKAADVPLLANDILYVPDSKGRRTSLAVLERVLLFGSTAGATALIYRGR